MIFEFRLKSRFMFSPDASSTTWPCELVSSVDNSRTGVEAAAYSLSLEEDEVAIPAAVVEGNERVIFRGVTNKLRPYPCASAARAASNSGTEFATEDANMVFSGQLSYRS